MLGQRRRVLTAHHTGVAPGPWTPERLRASSSRWEFMCHIPVPYPPEFQAEAVGLARSTGKTPQQVADDPEVSRRLAAAVEVRPPPVTSGGG
jgi:hypothetical protein